MVSLAALALSIVCILRKEKYNAVLVTDKDNIGLQNFDLQGLQTTVDGLQTTVGKLQTTVGNLQSRVSALEDADYVKRNTPYAIKMGTGNYAQSPPDRYMYGSHDNWRVAYDQVTDSAKWLFV